MIAVLLQDSRVSDDIRRDYRGCRGNSRDWRLAGGSPGGSCVLSGLSRYYDFLVPVFIPVSVPARAVPENLPVVRYVYRTPAANAPGQTEGDMNAQVGEAAKKPDAAEIIFAVWGIGFLAGSRVSSRRLESAR